MLHLVGGSNRMCHWASLSNSEVQGPCTGIVELAVEGMFIPGTWVNVSPGNWLLKFSEHTTSIDLIKLLRGLAS